MFGVFLASASKAADHCNQICWRLQAVLNLFSAMVISCQCSEWLSKTVTKRTREKTGRLRKGTGLKTFFVSACKRELAVTGTSQQRTIICIELQNLNLMRAFPKIRTKLPFITEGKFSNFTSSKFRLPNKPFCWRCCFMGAHEHKEISLAFFSQGFFRYF